MTRIAAKMILVVVLFLAACLPVAGEVTGQDFSGPRFSGAAAGNPTVSLFPADTYIQPGDLCTLQVYVDDAVDSLSCMEIVLAYDTMIVDCELVIEGDLYQTAMFPTFFDWEKTASDTVLAIDCVLGYRTYILAPGELARFVFRAVGEGSCVVRLTGVTLWDIDRIKLDVEAGGEAIIHVSTVSGDEPVPRGGSTLRSYPNPFNPSTTIVLNMRSGSSDGSTYSLTDVDISIFDPAGLLVRRLFEGPLAAGSYRFEWDGRSDRGTPVASGVYFALARTGDRMLKRKLVLLR